jgi:flavin reductase (DIM6/NTAB) family NADH-FMN oxidoreductase RutF
MSEQDLVKSALRMMPYGFYALTSRNGDDVNAMVVNWVTQASYTPRLLVIGLAKSAYSHSVISEGGIFTLNLFRADDKDAIMGLTKSREKNPDKMKDAKYTEAPETGCPVIDGAAAYLECRVVQLIDVGGDHDILVGAVINADVLIPGEASDTLSLPDIGWSYAG